jgi:hypothetical protein
MGALSASSPPGRPRLSRDRQSLRYGQDGWRRSVGLRGQRYDGPGGEPRVKTNRHPTGVTYMCFRIGARGSRLQHEEGGARRIVTPQG